MIKRRGRAGSRFVCVYCKGSFETEGRFPADACYCDRCGSIMLSQR